MNPLHNVNTKVFDLIKLTFYEWPNSSNQKNSMIHIIHKVPPTAT